MMDLHQMPCKLLGLPIVTVVQKSHLGENVSDCCLKYYYTLSI